MVKQLTNEIAALFIGSAAAGTLAADLSGITLKCAFIGGANYEELYKAIPQFEEQTGAEVEIVGRTAPSTVSASLWM